jgi:HupE / UreJ protein
MRRVSRALQASAWTALLVLMTSHPSGAHPLKVGLADISIEPLSVQIRLSVNLVELDLLMGLDRNLDARVEPQEIDDRRRDLVGYLADKVKVSAGGEALHVEAGPLGIGRSSDGRPTFDARLTFRLPGPLDGPLTIQCEPLTDLGPDHQTIATIFREGRHEQFVFQKGVAYQARARRGFLGEALQFLGLGIHHILIGYDHIAFLLALLLSGGGWKSLLAIVTSFTLAHSVTLSLAVLDVVTLPGRLVEVGIAFSVAYVALGNLLSPEPRRRWLVSFFFGLVHGFGFAGILKDMALPRSGLLSSLLFFNLGVEVGQVLVISVMLPLLWMLRRSTVHRAVVRAGSLAIFAVGVLWLYQRAF